MSPKQADQLIKSGKTVTVRDTFYNQTFAAKFVRRDRFSVYTAAGGVFDRKSLVVVEHAGHS